jgi:ERCC4-type nuclease
MSVKIDCRETQLVSICTTIISNKKKFQDISLETESLPIGDIIVTGSEVGNDIVIERKSVADLSASIKDGRYKEQSLRLSSSEYHTHNIIYVIEGPWTSGFFGSTLDKDTLYGSIVSMMLLKGYSVFRTESVSDTAEFICNMARKLKKTSVQMKYRNDTVSEISVEKGESEPILSCEKEEELHYTSTIKVKKKDNVTTDNIGVIMLLQIPNVSHTTAITVMNKYKSIRNLIDSLIVDNTVLNDLTYTTSSGQSRKISTPARENIIEYLLT